MEKKIWVVWDVNGDFAYYSTEDKAYGKCVEIIREVMKDDKEEMRLCLDELEEYMGATDVAGYYAVIVDEDEDDTAAHDEDECAVCKEFRKLVEDNVIAVPERGNGVRDMKYHIYNEFHPGQPLCENGKALEFDTEEDAIFFMESIIKNTDFDMTGAYIVADILYYDGGYIDGTGCFINKKGHLCKILRKDAITNE